MIIVKFKFALFFSEGKFRRVVSSQIKPSSVTVTCDFRNIIFRPGIATDVNVTVRNHGRRVSSKFFSLVFCLYTIQHHDHVIQFGNNAFCMLRGSFIIYKLSITFTFIVHLIVVRAWYVDEAQNLNPPL